MRTLPCWVLTDCPIGTSTGVVGDLDSTGTITVDLVPLVEEETRA